MEQTTITSTTTKGLVIGLVLVILELARYFINMDTNSPVVWIGYTIFVAGIIWSVYSYGKQVDHNSTFGNYFAHGFKVAAVITVVMIIYIIIFITLFPDFKEKALDKAKIAMRQKNNMTEEQMAQGMEIARKFFLVLAVGGTLVFYLIFGALAALIGAGITKKEPLKAIDDINQLGK